MGPQDTDQYIFLDESETLYVQFRNSRNLQIEMNMPEIAENMRKQRREDFEKVMLELLHLYNLPITVKILGDFEKPGQGPVLEIDAFRFDQYESGDFVATIRAKLTRYGEVNTLGTYTQRDVPPVSVNREQIDEAFRKVIRKPLIEMMDDLLQHFPSPEEKKRVNAPLNELDEGGD